MNYLEGNIRKLYFRFLIPSVTGAIAVSIYSFVDTIAVGQSEGATGAGADVLPKTLEYGRIIIWALPIFVFTIFIPAFIRNDGAPKLAMAAVIMGSYFFFKRCGLRLVKPKKLFKGFMRIFQIGIGASALDLGSIFIGIVMNNQIAKYGGTEELAVYGVIATIMSLLQALFGGVGQALQPLASTNYGTRQEDRIKKVWHYSLITVLIMGVIIMLIGEVFPIPITNLFMRADSQILQLVPRAFRLHFPAYLFLGVVVISAYYLQSVMRQTASMVVGFLHSIVLSSAMCLVLPLLLGMDGVWLAIPVTDCLISVFVVNYNRRLKLED